MEGVWQFWWQKKTFLKQTVHEILEVVLMIFLYMSYNAVENFFHRKGYKGGVRQFWWQKGHWSGQCQAIYTFLKDYISIENFINMGDSEHNLC